MSRRCVAQGVCFDRSPITSIFTVFGIFFLRFPILLHSLAWRRLFFSFIAYRLSLTDVCTHVFKAFTTLSISRSSDVFNVQNYRSLYRNLSPKSTLPFQWHYVSRFVFTATHSKDKVTAPFVATDDKSTLAKYCPPPPIRIIQRDRRWSSEISELRKRDRVSLKNVYAVFLLISTAITFVVLTFKKRRSYRRLSSKGRSYDNFSNNSRLFNRVNVNDGSGFGPKRSKYCAWDVFVQDRYTDSNRSWATYLSKDSTTEYRILFHTFSTPMYLTANRQFTCYTDV